MGALPVIALAGGVLALGLHPEGAAPLVAGGVATGLASGAAGTWLLGSAVRPRGADARAALRFQVALFGEFALQLVVAVGSVLALFFSGLKFLDLAAFGIAFASTVMVFRLASSVALAGMLRSRARSSVEEPSRCGSG